MPRLNDVVQVLETYRGRYRYLDAFVDDIDEFAQPQLGVVALPLGPGPKAEVWVDGRRVGIELFSDRGVARFWLVEGASEPQPLEMVGLTAALGGTLGAALGAASETKEGLLGGLVLGMLVGGLIGAAAAPTPVDRALALTFDTDSSRWMLYDGPLLNWAKRTLISA
jgi:hypothetical protein